jgi:hypothetical protein
MTANPGKPETYADYVAQADKRHRQEHGKALPLPPGIRLHINKNGKAALTGQSETFKVEDFTKGHALVEAILKKMERQEQRLERRKRNNLKK